MRPSRRTQRLALWPGLLTGVAAFVAVVPGADGQTAATREHFEGTADHVYVMVARPTATKDGYRLVVTLKIDRGYHVNANPASAEDLIPASLHMTGVVPLRVNYPKPMQFKPKFAEAAIAVYEGTVQITAELPPEAARSWLSGTIRVQACTDQICLPPDELPLPGLPPASPAH